jgi:predicted DNA-binding transcriptional regulator AlpA
MAFMDTSATGVEPLLSADQVGDLLGITPRTVKRLAADGALTRVVLGHRTTRYRQSDVAALIERCEQHPGATALGCDVADVMPSCSPMRTSPAGGTSDTLKSFEGYRETRRAAAGNHGSSTTAGVGDGHDAA